MAAPLVSICVPAYNQVEYLDRTLGSVLEQDLQDFELIISDDSSTEEVSDLVGRYRDRFSDRFRYTRNRPALGTPANWNAAITRSRGAYIKIMHHDEWFAHPGALRRFVGTMESSGAGMAFSSVITHVAKDGRSWELHPTEQELTEILSVPELIMLANIIGPPSSTIIRREAWIPYDTRFKYVVDMAQYIALFRSRIKVVRIDEALVHAVSDAGHNVSGYSRTPDIELKEYLTLFDELVPDIPKRYLPRFNRFLFGLFVRYGIDHPRKLRAVYPVWTGGGAHAWNIRKTRLFRLRERLLGRTTDKHQS